jgi:hypothetical protein
LSWAVHQCDNGVHVAPDFDRQPHDLTAACPCRPARELVNHVWIYVHNAFDGREITERALEALGGQRN